MVKRAIREKIRNIYFLDPVEKKTIPNLLAEADVALIVSQNSPLYRFGTSFNKLFDCLAAGLPVCAAIDEPHSLVEELRLGDNVRSGKPEDILASVNRLVHLQTEKREDIALRARAYIQDHGNYSVLAEEFISFAEQLQG